MSVSRHIPIAVCGVAVLLAVLMAPVPLDDPNGGKGIGRVRLAKLPRLGEPARFGLPQEELRDDLWVRNEQPEPAGESVEKVDRILKQLPSNYRRLLELRFLRGYSLKEVAAELGTTLGGVKVMQLRALRAAARVPIDG